MTVKHIGMVIKLKPEKAEVYRALHADSNPGGRDLLQKHNIRNFSTFARTLDDGNEYLFGYYEYTGNNLDADRAALAKEERNVEWHALCDPCQVPLEGEKKWAVMEPVFYND